MISSTYIQHITDRVKTILYDAEAGHDWLHISRVLNNAVLISDAEPSCQKEIVILAALLHDIADSKFQAGDEEIGLRVAANIMIECNVPEHIKKEVILIIQNISFKGGFTNSEYDSLELDIVRDADRLDAIGAIGIARAFTYGGYKNRRLYDAAISPVMYEDKESYKHSKAPTINHFYEKLLKLKALMQTNKGKQMAEERHKFMLEYLDHFHTETGLSPFK